MFLSHMGDFGKFLGIFFRVYVCLVKLDTKYAFIYIHMYAIIYIQGILRVTACIGA